MAKENHLSYVPTAEGSEKIEKIRAAFIAVDDLLDELVTENSRAKSLSKTHLEESRMWAVQAIVALNNSGAAQCQGTVSGSQPTETAQAA